MRILVKNKKWIISFANTKLVCDVYSKDEGYNIEFPYERKNVKIKTSDLDQTFKFLEKMFDGKEKIKNRMFV